MKVISLLQPWATLVVTGAKKIETRSWKTRHRGELLVHASAGRKRIGRELAALVKTFEIRIPPFDELPFGAIIGKVDLIDTGTTGVLMAVQSVRCHGMLWELNNQEIAFGDYTEGRYAWLFCNAVQFKHPIPAKGALSTWDYEFKHLRGGIS